jgi:hypothetical protein
MRCPPPRLRTLSVRAALAAAVWATGVPGVATSQETAPPSSGLVEVGRLPVPGNPPASGWLVLNPRTRRAYQLFEDAAGTVVQSYDLDTLTPLRRLELNGFLVPLGHRDGHVSSGQTIASGEVAHALDEEAGILYLAISGSDPATIVAGNGVGQLSTSPDARRWTTRFVAIDEKALDEGREAVASFQVPELQARLHQYWLMGMAVDRHRRSPASAVDGRPVGRLVLLFAQPNHPNAPVHNHELVRWDVSRGDVLRADAVDRGSNGLADPFAAADGGQVLDACRFSTITGGFGYNANGSGFQWELLVRRDDILFVCQSAPQSAAVARMELVDGAVPSAGGVTLYVLGRLVYDAITDGERKLFLRTTGDDGETWWVFDTDTRRFAGSLAAKTSRTGSMSVGVDHSTGRLYMLLTDYPGYFGGKQASVRGGFFYADTRLDSPVPFENARPDLAYPAHMRIQVDPATRRVFVRRGHTGAKACVKYPAAQATSTCPIEGFYRVLKDAIPVPVQPAEPDDAAFTTDVAERDGVTRASYLGTASGYGVRALFLNGIGANGQVVCGTDDRDVLAGSVGNVSVSDLSTAAEASSLDADIGTQKVAATPAQSCRPQQLVERDVNSPADHDEASFDKRDNEEPEVEVPDGVNDYEASCTGDGTDRPPMVDGRVPRHGFSSEVTCDRKGERAEGKATGELSLPEGALGVRVAKGHSEARIVRKAGEGIKAVVDSWARGIVIPNVGEIGAVRGEAVVEAAGRPGTATTRFERTVCDVDFGEFQHLGCLDLEKDTVIDKLNEAATGRAEFRLRQPDPAMERGSRSGYRAAVQRDRLDGFEDQKLARDNSLAVPTLEVVVYDQGRRRTFHLAGVQAAVSYGIACLNGQGRDGKCADGLDEDDLSDELLPDDAGDIAAFDDDSGSSSDDIAFDDGTTEALGPFGPSRGESAVTRFLRAPVRAVAAALRLLFNNPRELGLMTAVWLLLYGPFRLAGRHRSVRSLRRRRLAT